MSLKNKFWAVFITVNVVLSWFLRELTKEVVFGWISNQLGCLMGEGWTTFLASTATWLGPIAVIFLAMLLTVVLTRRWPIHAVGTNDPSLEITSARELSHAIYEVALFSAWGKWQDAMHSTSSGP